MLWLAVLLVVGVMIWWVRRLPVGPPSRRRSSPDDSGFGSDALLFGAADMTTADSTASDSSSFDSGSSGGSTGDGGGGGTSTAD